MLRVLESELDLSFIQPQRERGVSIISSTRSLRNLMTGYSLPHLSLLLLWLGVVCVLH